MTAKIETKGLNLWYGRFHALMDVSLSIRPRAITAIIGPSGCGKSTLLYILSITDVVSAGVEYNKELYKRVNVRINIFLPFFI